MQALVPTRALAVLLLIGFLDLISTAVLHQRGLIQEMNPVMRVFIDRSEWLFVVVKGATLLAAWYVLAKYAKTNMKFVRTACVTGCFMYLGIWLVWFTTAAVR